jgi:hypothetical protein
MMRRWLLFVAVLITSAWGVWIGLGNNEPTSDTDRAGRHLRATYSPLHFKPAIATATDEQCLACHREVLDDKPRPASPSGFRAIDARASYQELTTYSGDQETFHRRHLVTPLARQLMHLKCNTCHEGHDPREEAQGASATSAAQSDAGFTLRKQVNPETTCLKCHGRMPWEKMTGLKGPWPQVREDNENDCLFCHAKTRTIRHRVNYLNTEAIEAAGKANADVCYGCHGGRAWYRIAYPYSLHRKAGAAPNP